MNNMTVNFDMFCAFLKNKNFGNVKGSLDVTVEVHGLRMRDVKIIK